MYSQLQLWHFKHLCVTGNAAAYNSGTVSCTWFQTQTWKMFSKMPRKAKTIYWFVIQNLNNFCSIGKVIKSFLWNKNTENLSPADFFSSVLLIPAVGHFATLQCMHSNCKLIKIWDPMNYTALVYCWQIWHWHRMSSAIAPQWTHLDGNTAPGAVVMHEDT